jgi:hypothetical protein
MLIFGYSKKSMLGSDSGIISPLPSLPKPNASNVHITSVGTKTEDPKPQRPRLEIFGVHAASVLTSSTDFN